MLKQKQKQTMSSRFGSRLPSDQIDASIYDFNSKKQTVYSSIGGETLMSYGNFKTPIDNNEKFSI